MRLKLKLGVALLGLVVVEGQVVPEATAQEVDASSPSLQEVVIVGSRRQERRSAADSLVPVDLIDGDQLLDQGATDMDSLLAALIPSYNVDQQAINDAATLVRPARLRGLPPDSALVLVNGKRRHRAAVIAFLGNGVADGSQGPDLSVIPAIAVERVEVLRDGAAAQYGSDAIAGVVNVQLKDEPNGRQVELRWGQFYEGDGEGVTLAANAGVPLTDAGFASFSVEVKQADGTDRSRQRGDAQSLVDAGNPYITDPSYDRVFHPNVMIWGAPEVKHDAKFFGNLGLDLGNGREAYAFGNYAERELEGGFFYRNPHTRSGVFKGDPVTVDGTTYETVKVADLSSDGMSGNCPPIRIVDDVASAADIASVEANPDCFSFISAFPGGFTPRFGGTVIDFGAAVGVRGALGEDWRFDASAVFGSNDVNFFMRHTINPQLIAELPHGQRVDIPTDYRPGSYTETDYTFNLDLSRPVYLDLFFSPLNLAFGLEFRGEEFKVESGEENSWFIDDRPGGLAEQGFGIGSNGFTGFGPRLAGEFNRSSSAAYLDVEVDVLRTLMLAVAARYEDHQGVGDTLDGKLTARWEFADGLALRSAVSTGFRAPTVGQANILNVTTAFTGGMLADEATLPPTHPAARVVGAVPLAPEESTNFSAGIVFSQQNLELAADFFRIEVRDRIARSSEKALTQAAVESLLAQGVADARSFTSVRFYTNNFDTTTQGLDLSVAWARVVCGGALRVVFSGNWTDTQVDRRDPAVINDKRVVQIEENTPSVRFLLTASFAKGPWKLLLRGRHYGDFVEFSTDDETARLEADARFFADVQVSRAVGDSLTLIVGAENVFDKYPTRQSENVSGLVYAETAPYGPNGGYYYARAVWSL